MQDNINNNTILTQYEFNTKIKQLEAEPYAEERKSFHESVQGLTDKDKAEMSSWLIRQYFSPEKNQGNFWFSETNIPTEETVLKFISEPSNRFPHTLLAVAEQFKLNKSLRKTLNLLNDEEDIELDTQKNMVGEMTLRDVGVHVGNVTPTMVNKLTDKALDKCKTFLGNYESVELGIKFKKFFNETLRTVSFIYYQVFLEEETLDEALANLLANDIIKSKDFQYISSKEFKELETLFSLSKEITLEDFQKILIEDFYDYGNKKYETFQSSVSRVINPDDKTGRKKLDEVSL